MKLPAYPRTKSSGVEWLGDVPEHWDVKSLTRVTISIRNGTSATQLEDNSESSVPVTRIESISGGRINFDKVGQVEWTPTLENFRLKKGDILLSHINSLSMVGNCAIFDSDRPLYSGMNLLRIQPEPTVHAPWLWRVLSGDGVRKEVSARAKPAINQASVTTTQIKALQLPVPPVSEQRAIAAFLDRETGRVDRLVAKKRELIERLKEKRTALISRTVTRGLPPAAARAAGLPANPPLKPTALDRLGDIPKHWEAVRLKHLLKLRKGAVKTGPFGSQLQSAEMMDGEIKVYNQRSVIDRNLTGGDNYISLEKFDELRAFEVFPNDLLVTTRGTIGRCAILPAGSERGILHPCLMRVQFDPRRVNNRFAEILIQDSGRVLEQLELKSNATTIDVIYSESLREIWFALPPLPEQAAIAAYLDKETAKLDALVGKVEAAVERLQEYRTALITAAVTGKIDVRQAALDGGGRLK